MKEFNPSNVLFVRQALPGRTATDIGRGLANWMDTLPEGRSFAFEVPTYVLDGKLGQKDREKLIRANAIAAVILLPLRSPDPSMNMKERLHARQSSSIIILTKDASRVRMAALDREAEFRVRGFNGLEDEKVLALANEVGPNVFDVDPAKILENGCSLLPDDYFDLPSGACKRERLDAVASVVRSPFVMRQKMKITETPTGYRLLSLRTLMNPIAEMPYLDDIPEEAGRFCLQPGDIIMSRIMQYRLRFLTDLEGQQIFADNNVYVLRAKQEVLLPSVLYFYLCSEAGQSCLAALGKGYSRTINLKSLETLPVPVPDREQQIEISAQYDEWEQKLAEARQLRQKIEERINAL